MDFEKDYIATQRKKHIQDILYNFFTKRIPLWSNYSSIWWMIPILVPICLILSVKNAIKKLYKKKHKWNPEKADECCYAIAQYILVKDENGDYICYLDDCKFSHYKIKLFPRRLRKYTREFNLEIFSYFINNFELEGYAKEVYFDPIELRYEIVFTKENDAKVEE